MSPLHLLVATALAVPVLASPASGSEVCVKEDVGQTTLTVCREADVPALQPDWDALERLLCDQIIARYGPDPVTYTVGGQEFTLDIPALCSGLMTGEDICIAIGGLPILGDVWQHNCSVVIAVVCSTVTCPSGTGLKNVVQSVDDAVPDPPIGGHR